MNFAIERRRSLSSVLPATASIGLPSKTVFATSEFCNTERSVNILLTCSAESERLVRFSPLFATYHKY